MKKEELSATEDNSEKALNKQLEPNEISDQTGSQEIAEVKVIFPTPHSLLRASKRGITSKMIKDTICFGERIYKQGLQFYVMLRKHLPPEIGHHYAEKLVNTTVILSADDFIVTVYKNKNAFRNIKRKSKRLQ